VSHDFLSCDVISHRTSSVYCSIYHTFPTPYALCPMPYALRPTSYALRPTPYTQRPMPYALAPYALVPYTLRPRSTLYRLRSTHALHASLFVHFQCSWIICKWECRKLTIATTGTHFPGLTALLYHDKTVRNPTQNQVIVIAVHIALDVGPTMSYYDTRGEPPRYWRKKNLLKVGTVPVINCLEPLTSMWTTITVTFQNNFHISSNFGL